jgi:hypothetical protein
MTRKKTAIVMAIAFVAFVTSVEDTTPVSTLSPAQIAAKEKDDSETKEAIEAKAKADAEYKVKFDAEKKVKEEVEAKANSEKKANEEAVAKADAEKKAKEEALAAESKAAEDAKKKIPGSPGINSNQFMTSYNAAGVALDTALRIKGSLDFKEGAVENTFQVMVTENIALVGSVNKVDSSLISVVMIGQGNGTLNSGTDIIIGMLQLICATNPKSTNENRLKVLEDIGMLKKNSDITSIDGEAVLNGKKYSAIYLKSMGLMFTASDANEK